MVYLTAFVGLTFLSAVLAQEYIADTISVKKCPVSVGGKEEDFNLGLDVDGDSKSLSLNADLSRVLNEECTYKAQVEVLNDGKYVHYFNGNGKVCEGLSNLVKPAWEKFKSTMDPPIKESCTVRPGKYSLKGFTINKDEANIPFQATGQFRTELRMSCDYVEVGCVVLEIVLTEDDD